MGLIIPEIFIFEFWDLEGVKGAGFIYLGLPIGNDKFIEDFFLRNVETVKNHYIHLGLLVVNQRHSILEGKVYF